MYIYSNGRAGLHGLSGIDLIGAYSTVQFCIILIGLAKSEKQHVFMRSLVAGSVRLQILHIFVSH